jgi:hypothetical protein
VAGSGVEPIFAVMNKPEADVIKGLVINAIGLVGVLDQLVDGEGGVVRLHHGVRHLGRGHHGVGVHDPVGVFLADLGNEECAQAGSGAAPQRVGQLESLLEEKQKFHKIRVGLGIL